MTKACHMSPFFPPNLFFLRVSPQTPSLPALCTGSCCLLMPVWYQVEITVPHELKIGHTLLLLVLYSLIIISTSLSASSTIFNNDSERGMTGQTLLITLLCLQESH